MALTIDKNLCIGCGTCVALCPENFQMNQTEGKAEVIKQEESEAVNNCVESCPTQAIKL